MEITAQKKYLYSVSKEIVTRLTLPRLSVGTICRTPGSRRAPHGTYTEMQGMHIFKIYNASDKMAYGITTGTRNVDSVKNL